jgi:hypothetical protein
MGQHAACTLRFRGHTQQGTAWLEAKELLFRGPERVAIPLKDITAATSDGGVLRVAFAGQTAQFEIGPAAAKWAERITNPPSRLDKLGIKTGMTVLPVGYTDRRFFVGVRARGARIVRSAPAGGVDAFFFGAARRDDLERLAAAARSLKQDGALWVVRPKGTKAITEAETMAAGKRAGLVDVKVVSFSDTHTAEKFMIPRSSRRS